MLEFNPEKWLDEKKLELVNLMFQNEFGIQNFRNTTTVINFDDLQTEVIRDRVNKYRIAMGALFKAEEIRSVLDYYYLQQDKKPVLNLLKQILKYYGYEFNRTSEYQGNYAGKKVYKSKYTITLIKKSNKKTQEDNDDTQEEYIDEDHQQEKKKILSKLVKTYKINLNQNETHQ